MTEQEFEELLELADKYDIEAGRLLNEGKVDEANAILDLRDAVEAKIEQYCENELNQ